MQKGEEWRNAFGPQATLDSASSYFKSEDLACSLPSIKSTDTEKTKLVKTLIGIQMMNNRDEAKNSMEVTEEEDDESSSLRGEPGVHAGDEQSSSDVRPSDSATDPVPSAKSGQIDSTHTSDIFEGGE